MPGRESLQLKSFEQKPAVSEKDASNTTYYANIALVLPT
jgi:hypothetical protein